MLGFILKNECGGIDPKDVATMAGDLSLQLVEAAPWWQRQPLAVRLDSPLASAEEWATAVIVPELDEPDALAYHSIDVNGRPYVEIGWSVIRDNGGGLWTSGVGLLSAISHEFLETFGDPYCDFNVDMFDDSETPVELCDAVQGDTYEIIPGSDRYVSNFLGPRWFGAASQVGPYDRMGLCTRPRELRPGGYLSIRRGGRWTNVFGAEVPEHVRRAKRAGRTRRTLGKLLVEVGP